MDEQDGQDICHYRGGNLKAEGNIELPASKNLLVQANLS